MSTRADSSFALEADDWLGAQIGKPTWRVTARADGAPLSKLREASSFAYAKVAASEVDAVRRLAGHGFYPVDTAVTFEGPPYTGVQAQCARFAEPSDRDAVRNIAGTSFKYSRFHLDPAVAPRLANDIKANWAANFFSGERGDAMVVAELRGRVVGFLQLLWQPADVLVIDLVGVDADYRGRGLARQMISFASTHGVAGRAPALVRVGTQVANTPSVRLYESLGLRLAGAQYILHFHS